ncbi:MAG: peptide ABC transporter substrate-binding protein [Chlamydiota bacterium]|nr:peptide ABC transporter substrate-binding protein [Chlamydiota bacterium]
MRKLILPLLILSCLQISCNPDPRTAGPTDTKQEIRVGISSEPQVFDPRLIRDTPSVNVSHMLFEGLMQKNYVGKVVPAIARYVDISADGKKYTFHLKNTLWSDGSLVTAYDFEYSWKSILDPNFPAPNAYQLYILKGARNAKSGKASLDDVGVKALNDSVLVVELEHPVPYFLELTTTHFYSPVNRKWAEETKDSLYSDPKTIITNGPFKLTQSLGNDIVVEKNPLYWDADQVHLEKISLYVVNENTALQMFQRGEIDWVGSPMSTIPPDAIPTLKNQGKLTITPADGVHFFRINTSKEILDQTKIRKALAYSINRKELVDHVTQANQEPAMGIVPRSYGLQTIPHFKDYDITAAWSNFQDALNDLKMSKDDLPEITLLYTQSERNHKIVQAIQEQWRKTLGFNVKLEACERAVFYERLHEKNYDISIGSWYGDIRDPINFLEVFKYKASRTNNTEWENSKYIALLDKSSLEANSYERKILLRKAENIIIDDMAVIPLYYPTFNHLQEGVSGVYFSELGYVDFKYAYKD